MRISQGRPVFLLRESVKPTRFGRHATAANTDRNLPASIKRIDRICESCRLLMILGDGDREQIAFSTRLQRMNHPEC